jgi:hypothetical protein
MRFPAYVESVARGNRGRPGRALSVGLALALLRWRRRELELRINPTCFDRALSRELDVLVWVTEVLGEWRP